MRSFINGSGVDVTAAVNAYLATHRAPLLFADLYQINTAPQYAGQYLGRTFMLTDYPSPLNYGYVGVFNTANIKREGVKSKIGLEVITVSTTWAPRSTDILATDGSGNTILTALQGFRYGLFQNATVNIYRCLMPTVGDCNTFGACLLFSGRIGQSAPDRMKVVFAVNSRTELLNVQIPTNTIEPTNILAQYSVGTLPPNGPTSFTVESGSTQNIIYAIGSNTGYVPTNGTYNSGYLVFTSGKLAGHYAKVFQQTIDVGEHAFYLQDPLPFAPTVGDTLGAFIYIPPDQDTAVAQGSPYEGWPFVPVPVNSTVVI